MILNQWGKCVEIKKGTQNPWEQICKATLMTELFINIWKDIRKHREPEVIGAIQSPGFPGTEVEGRVWVRGTFLDFCLLLSWMTLEESPCLSKPLLPYFRSEDNSTRAFQHCFKARTRGGDTSLGLPTGSSLVHSTGHFSTHCPRGLSLLSLLQIWTNYVSFICATDGYSLLNQ